MNKLSILLRGGSIAFFMMLLISSGYSQEVLRATKITEPIIIDGRVDESVWNSVPPLNVTQKVPDAGANPTQKTELRLAYDNQYLYLSGRMYDSEPDKMVLNSKKRDDFTENTEWCGLLIDSYNDRENALAFFVTPHGSKLDMALSNDIQGPTAFNLSWNSYWDGAASRDEHGWYAEIRIPFTSLPFEVVDGEVVMGITTWRYLARNDETDIFPPRDLSTGSSFRPSLTQRFSFRDIDQSRPVHITPYILTGMANAQVPTNTDDGWNAETKFKKEIGLDAKLALGSNATLDLTLNTDFAQVEADDQQVNLTRLNLFFPEKRLFFQERSSLFEFNFGNSDRIFHSRRIGIVNGEQTRIYGGVRAYGRFGTVEAGLLNMQTGPRGDLGSENFSVFRVRKRVLNENSTVGMILTNRTDLNGNYNTVYGLDATLRVHKQNYLALRWAQSFTEENNNSFSALDQSKFFIELSKRSQEGFTYTLNYGRAGKDYVPRIGFEHRPDFSQFNYILNYNMFPSKSSKIVQHGPYAVGGLTWGNSHGQLETRNSHFGYTVITKLGWTYDLSFRSDEEQLFQSLALPGDISIEAGRHPFNSVFGSVTTSSIKRLSYRIGGGGGKFYNGHKNTIFIAPFYNVTPDFIVEVNYSLNRLKFSELGKEVNVALTRIKMLYTFNTRLTINAFIQHNNVSKTFLGSIRLRYNPKEGNDFYFVFNGDLNQGRFRNDLQLPVSNGSTFFLKYSHTFHF
ncbi:MAG: carbohydrate binding family 9 domain-containing protein [Roseivirga sp.]|nr:carbohydrate binding family 9 domain-containing protein [Roseivirga sp.]